MSEYRILNKKGQERYRYDVDEAGNRAGPADLGSGMAANAGRALSGRQLQLDAAVDYAVRGNNVKKHKTRSY